MLRSWGMVKLQAAHVEVVAGPCLGLEPSLFYCSRQATLLRVPHSCLQLPAVMLHTGPHNVRSCHLHAMVECRVDLASEVSSPCSFSMGSKRVTGGSLEKMQGSAGLSIRSCIRIIRLIVFTRDPAGQQQVY